MKYAIIAAGEGSRLAQDGVSVPKPLVRIGGEPLIDRLVRVFLDNDATDICIICNEHMTAVADHLRMLQRSGLNGRTVPLRLVVKTTPSSMHSFFELSRLLQTTAEGQQPTTAAAPSTAQAEPFILTTVDTVFREADFAAYVDAVRRQTAEGADGVMAVTPFVDDEKPLWVATEGHAITGFHDQQNGCHLVSGGIYGLTAPALATLRRCVERGESRMRNFQRALIADGLHLQAYIINKVFDVDHQADIMRAEEFLSSHLSPLTSHLESKDKDK